MNCPSCKKQLPEGSVFCCYCGASIPPAKINKKTLLCPKCKAEFNDDVAFCGKCGSKLVLKPATPPLEIKVSNTFTIVNIGIVVMGTVLDGEVNLGDTVYCKDTAFDVMRIEADGTETKNVKAGKEIGILLKGDTNKIKKGSTITNKVAISTPEPAPAPSPAAAPAYSESTPEDTPGNMIMQINATSIYPGKTAVGVEILSGTIYIYADRIEAKAALASTPEVFVRMNEIASVSKSKYMLMWSSIVLTLKNGNAFTLASAVSGSATIDRAIQIINNGISRSN